MVVPFLVILHSSDGFLVGTDIARGDKQLSWQTHILLNWIICEPGKSTVKHNLQEQDYGLQHLQEGWEKGYRNTKDFTMV